MTTLADLNKDVNPVMENPQAIMRIVLDRLEDGQIVDPSNPFVFGIETACSLASALNDKLYANVRKVYPSLAVEEEDLYRHMSDEDYKQRFALPALTNINVYIGLEELYAKAIATNVDGVKKLVIPRNSTFAIGGYTFTMQYPIELRIMQHGGLQIVYDVGITSPLLTLDSNVVNYKYVKISGIDFVALEIPAYQFEIAITYSPVSSATGFTTIVPFVDQFYYCRVYHSDVNGNWVEIKTTHSEQIYDPTIPTAVLTKLTGSVKVHIPIIYMTANLINSEIRIDIYTTKGPLALDLKNFDSKDFIATWVDLAGGDNTYSAPFETFSTMTVYSESFVSGGRDALSTKDLRARIIANSFSKNNIPITEFQLTNKLTDVGYTVVKSIDNVVNRVYLATRSLAAPSDKATATGAGTGIMLFQQSMDYLSTLSTVITNGSRLTILPETLYKRVNGVVEVLTDYERATILTSPIDSIINDGNTKDFIYTPFHYVMEDIDNKFNLRAYYLENPVITHKSFIAENASAGLQVSIKSYDIAKTSNGYTITILTRSSEEFVAIDSSTISVQLSYIAPEERYRAFINGTFIGQDPDSGERAYSFDINTNYDISSKDRFNVNSLKMFDAITVRDLLTDLETTFDIVFIIRDYTASSVIPSTIDSVVGDFLLPNNTRRVAITREQLTVNFGHALNNLWSKSKTVASGFEFETYTTDVPYLYPDNVYETLPNGNLKLVYNSVSQKLEANLLHGVGTPALDINDDPVYLHRVGDIKLDNLGKPIPKSSRLLLRQMYMCFVDGRYYLSNNASTMEYAATIPSTIINWLENDIEPNASLMLENTELLLYPQTTIGTVSIINEEGSVLNIEAEQVIEIDVYVSEQVYTNIELRVEMDKTITNETAMELNLTSVSLSRLNDSLLGKLGDGVFGINIKGLGGINNLKVATLKDLSQRLVLGKRLALGGDGTIKIENNININYFKHS